MKPWLLIPFLFAACTSIEEDVSVSPAEEVVVAEAQDLGIAVPFERVRTEPDKSQGAFVGQVVGADTWVQIS